MTYPTMDPRRLDLTGTFGLRVAGCDVSEVRIAGMGGRWERRVNLATRPVPTADAPGAFGGGAPWQAAHLGTPTIETSGGPDGGPTQWLKVGGARPSGTEVIIYAASGAAYRVPVSAGAPVDVSAFLWHDSPATTVSLQMIPYSATGAAIAYTAVVAQATQRDCWQRLKHTYTPPAGAVALRVGLRFVAASASAWTEADRFGGTGLLIGDDDGYYDGDTPDTPDALYRWQDAPHASPTTAYYAWQPV